MIPDTIEGDGVFPVQKGWLLETIGSYNEKKANI
jgi:hypothetical protein